MATGRGRRGTRRGGTTVMAGAGRPRHTNTRHPNPTRKLARAIRPPPHRFVHRGKPWCMCRRRAKTKTSTSPSTPLRGGGCGGGVGGWGVGGDESNLSSFMRISGFWFRSPVFPGHFPGSPFPESNCFVVEHVLLINDPGENKFGTSMVLYVVSGNLRTSCSRVSVLCAAILTSSLQCGELRHLTAAPSIWLL